ncbi:MAG: glutamine amidotransferase [Candidatus Nomurabacteria bacterium]|jgi:CobQ-like glutamine amidotransferase family enzyme|nr:glutamine amidotransferase [Candidatus Nomurabacteria bacterium]
MNNAKKSLTILHLYPREMNLYGDHGNILALQKRCHWRGIKTTVFEYEPQKKLPKEIDIIFGGGGQDSGQSVIQDDFLKLGEKLKKLVEDGVPTLVVCGLYQLFGNFFKTLDGEIIKGISVFNVKTLGGNERLIGNVVVESSQFGKIVGYENHSGRTFFEVDLQPLGDVKKGAGNNGEDFEEGVRYKNAIGTYLHGPILPKNPKIADFLIETALTRKYGMTKLSKLNDDLEKQAHLSSSSRPR